MVGRSSRGGKGSYIRFGSLEEDVPAMLDAGGNRKGETLTLAGVMVVQGSVQESQGLARLLADKRVYLVDTSEVEVRNLIASRHANVAAGRELTVNRPSPFWNFDW